jgi:hypothetical protein
VICAIILPVFFDAMRGIADDLAAGGMSATQQPTCFFFGHAYAGPAALVP